MTASIIPKYHSAKERRAAWLANTRLDDFKVEHCDLDEKLRNQIHQDSVRSFSQFDSALPEELAARQKQMEKFLTHFFAAHPDLHYFQGAASPLPFGLQDYHRQGQLRVNGHEVEGAVTTGDGLGDCSTFGTDCESIRGILHIAALVNFAVRSRQSRTDVVFAIWSNVVTLLTQTLNPLAQRQAEDTLKQLELSSPHFPLLLLSVADGSFAVIEVHVRMAAALLFKNFVKRHWSLETPLPSFTDEDRRAVKQQIVGILTKVPPVIQNQLCEAVTLIAAVDFPEEWPDLIQRLVERLNPADFDNNIAILKTLHRMFKRYRTEFRSDELYTEINFVLGQLASPLLEMYKALDALVESNASNKETLQKLLRAQILLNKIYYSLNAQDLPAFFEDNLGEFMESLKRQLSYKNAIVETTSEEEAGPAEKLPASVAKIAILYAMRYEEDFTQLGQFVEAAWSVLTTVSRQPKHDATAGACMRLLSTVAKQERHKSLFSGVLQLLCDKVIVPNILLRESDLELFEDEPLEFIRRSIDGGTEDEGRRGGAINLARGLMEFYENEITAILQSYVEEFLKIYSISPAQKWRDKNAAVHLFTAISIRGAVSSLGVTRVNPLVNIQDFFTRHILPDLQASNAALHPLLKIDAIKFLSDFRSQLDKEQLVASFPLIQHHLASHHFVVHTYAAIAIDRILSLRKQGGPVFTSADVASVADAIITGILRILRSKKQAEKVSENEFLVKAVLRTLVTAQKEVLLPIMDEPLSSVASLIGLVSVNPSNPIFNHNLFECAAAIIKYCSGDPTGATKIDAQLLPVLQNILQNDVTEFIHYVFQLLAVYVESRADSGLPATVQALVPPVLLPALWSSSENIPALTRFLQAVILRDPNYIVQNNLMPQVLGIFQSLISSKVHDVHAFSIIGTVIQSVPISNMESYISGILMVILNRLQSSKTPRLALNFLLFICIFVCAASVNQASSYLVRLFDSLQPKLLAGLMTGVLLTNGPKIRDRHDRKLVIVGLAKIATETPELMSGDQDCSSLFTAIISTVVTMLTTLPAGGLGEVNTEAEAEEEPSGTFWKLKVAASSRRCPMLDNLPEPAPVFINSLVALSRSQQPGKLSSLLSSLDQPTQNALSNLLHQSNASL
ncbi:hypothetical protein PSACC_03523 [Paramicrosporidium saccamoebae]|uniref:Importin N-terminal domain-containing protein n=1 Tax=Paramicrosporidium saccamoebae TaxID=1246581 RepID=A0A2H9TG06_9FUNG|nr:hypothetical protein PSACC_03523 [Paramicrosporidium saccamoebae]